MAVTPQIKANQLAKDLNIKSKDMMDIMAEKGLEIKSQKALEPHEFEVFFDAITSKYQIECIDDYIDGITFIPSRLEKTEKKPTAEQKEEIKAEKTVTAEKKPAETEKEAEKADAHAVTADKSVKKSDSEGEVAAKAEPADEAEKKDEKSAEQRTEEKPEEKPADNKLAENKLADNKPTTPAVK